LLWLLFIYIGLAGGWTAYYAPAWKTLSLLVSCVAVDLPISILFLGDVRTARALGGTPEERTKLRRIVAEDLFFGACLLIHNVYLVLCAFR